MKCDLCLLRDPGPILAPFTKYSLFAQFYSINDEDDNIDDEQRVKVSPGGTSFQVVMSLGCDWLRMGPTSEAQVSPALQARAPSKERLIQEAEYCWLKSMASSPGPTCAHTHARMHTHTVVLDFDVLKVHCVVVES